MKNALIFVDVEAGFDSPCPGVGVTGMTEFGAVEFLSRQTFHGFSACMDGVSATDARQWHATMLEFEKWLKQFGGNRPVFVSDNPAYDWQWINFWFHRILGRNPFGHSARRIGDFYAGLADNFYQSSEWKALRITKHDHNPVNDALGNVEAFERMLRGERAHTARKN